MMGQNNFSVVMRFKTCSHVCQYNTLDKLSSGHPLLTCYFADKTHLTADNEFLTTGII